MRTNPWRGLSAYLDPTKYQDKTLEYKFCGRETETIDMVKLIDNNLFVTLYGRTGIGKTSLLNAGVFPMLRQHNYYPIYIRLSQESSDQPYAETIIKKIKDSKIIKECPIESINELDNSDTESKSYLLKYFYSYNFQDLEGQEIYPVFVLDQFEEIFFTNRDKAELLLQQIHTLINDYLVLPKDSDYIENTNYRFVTAIREDNLFYLEDSIDTLALSSLKENRYRLRPFSPDNARKAILEPGSDCIDKNDANAIADKIIDYSKENDGSISSLILSLLCYILYENAQKANADAPVITLQHIPVSQDNTDELLVAYYLNNTTKKQQELIEEQLLTEEGHRKSADLDRSSIHNLMADGCRILQKVETDSGEKIEIVHDRLASVIYMQKRKKDDDRFLHLLRGVILSTLFLLICLAIGLSWSTTRTDRPLAKYIKNDPIPSTLMFNDSIVNFGDPRILDFIQPQITRIILGDSVQSIWGGFRIANDSLIFSISPGNKYFKWDSIYTTKGYIGYLHTIDNPNHALYIQKDSTFIKDAIIRLPFELRNILPDSHNYHYFHSFHNGLDTLPSYGITSYKINHTSEFPKYFKSDNKITDIELDGGINEIPKMAFKDCFSLTKINLDSITRIDQDAFRGCSSLRSIELNADSVYFEMSAFSSCTNLESISLPRKMTGDFTNLFAYCYNLKSIRLPEEIEIQDSTISLERIQTMFRFCYKIDNIEFNGNNRHYRYDSDSILYYDSIPFIFNKCVNPTISNSDDHLYIGSGVVSCSFGYINILPHQLPKAMYHDSCISFTDNSLNHYILPDDGINVLHIYDWTLPSTIIIIGDLSQITEVHTQVTDPDRFIMHRLQDYDPDNPYDSEDSKECFFNYRSHISLCVPHGCNVDYLNYYRFNDFQSIKQDSFNKLVKDTIGRYWRGISYTFSQNYFLLFLSGLGLVILVIMLYYYNLRITKSPTNQPNKKKALLSSLIALPIALIGFIPVYYLIFILIMNYAHIDGLLNFIGIDIGSNGDRYDIIRHYNIYNTIGMILGSIGGVISAVFCTYYFVIYKHKHK